MITIYSVSNTRRSKRRKQSCNELFLKLMPKWRNGETNTKQMPFKELKNLKKPSKTLKVNGKI